MAIGDVQASGGISRSAVQSSVGEINSQVGQGVAGAISDLLKANTSYLSNKEDMTLLFKQRADATEDLEVSNAELQFQQRMSEAYTERAREAGANPRGFTDSYDSFFDQESKAFIATLPPRVRMETDARVQQYRAQQRASAFSFELSGLDQRDKTTLNNSLNIYGTALKSGKTTLEDAQISWAEVVDKSALPSAEKEALKLSGNQTLATLQFGTEVEQVSAGYGTTGAPADGSDVVAAGLPPAQRAVLNAISAKESNSYGIINGGEAFTDYSKHPNKIGKGGTSTAAGRYQFIYSTWVAASASYEKTYGVKVPDFSPEWQDRVAAHWVEKRYNERSKNGMTFQEVIASNDPAKIATIRSVLGNPSNPNNPLSVEWEGFNDKHMTDAEFLAIYNGEKGVAGGGTGPAVGPNPWTDQRYAGIGLGEKLTLANQSAAAADARRKGEAEANAAQASALGKSLKDLGASTGDLSYIFTDLRNRPDFTEDMERQYRSGVEEFQKKESSAAEISGLLSSGQPLQPHQQEGLTNWFGPQRMEGLFTGNAAAYTDLATAGASARMFPTGTRDAVTAAMRDPAARPVAMEFLAGMLKNDPSLLYRSGFSDNDLADARVFGRLAQGFGSAEETLSAMEQMKITAAGEDSAKKLKEARASFGDKILPDLSSIIGDTWTNFEMPGVPADNITLQADALQAYSDGFEIYGNEDAAKEHMKGVLERMWGPTGVGTEKSLMRYPPESFYTPAAGTSIFSAVTGSVEPSFAYLNDKVRTAFGLTADDEFFLVGDATTEKEVREGKLPTYKVWSTSPEGVMELQVGRFGGEVVQPKADDTYSAGLGEARDERQMMERIDLAAEARNSAQAKLTETINLYGEGSVEVTEARKAMAEAVTSYENEVSAGMEYGYRPPTEFEKSQMTQTAPLNPVDPRMEEISALQSGPTGEAIRSRVTYLLREGRDPNGQKYNWATALNTAMIEAISASKKITLKEAEAYLGKDWMNK